MLEFFYRKIHFIKLMTLKDSCLPDIHKSFPTPIISGKVFLLLYSFLPRILYLNMSLQILGKHHWKRWTLLSH